MRLTIKKAFINNTCHAPVDFSLSADHIWRLLWSRTGFVNFCNMLPKHTCIEWGETKNKKKKQQTIKTSDRDPFMATIKLYFKAYLHTHSQVSIVRISTPNMIYGHLVKNGCNRQIGRSPFCFNLCQNTYLLFNMLTLKIYIFHFLWARYCN